MVTAFSPNLQVNGVISGGTGAGVTKIGTGQMILNGINTYTGPTTVNGANGSIVLATNNALPDTPLVINNGTLNVNGVTDAVSALSGTNNGTLALGSGSFTVGSGNTSTTFAGPITGTGTLTKVGTGTLTLTGNSPAYTGTTIVAGGTVLVNANQGAAAVSVGNTATLGGTGSVGAVTIGAGGTVAPGVAGPGILNAGTSTFGGGTFTVDLNGLTPGTQYDRLAVTGTANVNGVTLLVNAGFSPAIGNTFTILTTTGGITGNFRDALGNVLAEGSSFAVGNTRYSISYAGGNVTLTFRGLDIAGTLTASANPSLPGSPVTFTLALPAGTAGNVTFSATGPAPLPAPQTVPVAADGTAMATLTFTTPGTYTVTAAYSGSGAIGPKDFVLTQTVNFPTSTTLTASATSVASGQPVTFTVAVTSGNGTPTGTVTFVNASTGAVLGTVGLNPNGQASLTATLPTGNNTVVATYNGDTTFRASSGSVGISVAPSASEQPPFFTGAFVIGNLLVLQGNGLPGGIAILPVPPGTVALFADVNGDNKGDVILFFPDVVFILDGQTGRITTMIADFTGDKAPDILVFNADGSLGFTDGRTGLKLF
jgi:autotransporter-associated beta strand protein